MSVLCWSVLAIMGLSQTGQVPAQGDSASAGRKAGPEPSAEHVQRLLKEDPAAFLELCLQYGAPRVRDFRCRFIQNAVIGGELSGTQVTEALYRREVRSVYLRWLENPQGAKRILWIKGRHRAKDGTEQVRLEPTGIVGLIASNVLLSMEDPRILKNQRQPITEFGPDATLQSIVGDNRKAAKAGDLDLRYRGEVTVDGRPTYLLLRYLPYHGPQGPYGDAHMVLHIDQEWLVPVKIEYYADRDKQHLLERDEFVDLQVNVGLTDADFQF